jgi:L-alanine-DL-glutamate epimerase-like enolase superfamily enzyme
MILESVRGFYRGWYKWVYTDNVDIEEGQASFPTSPGLGTRLKPAFLEDPRTSRRVSVSADATVAV